MKQTQKTILEKARPVFKRTTQPIISAGARPYETGVQYTIKMRRVCGMGRAIDGENRRLSNGHRFRLSDEEEAAFSAFLAAYGLTVQDCVRGILLGKLRIDNDGLAAKLRGMSAKGRISDAGSKRD